MDNLTHINIKDHVSTCFTTDDGLKIQNIIRPLLDHQKQIEVSFKDIDSISISFLNVAFIDLLDSFDFDYIKKNLHFVNSNKTINNYIKSRFSFETSPVELI